MDPPIDTHVITSKPDVIITSTTTTTTITTDQIKPDPSPSPTLDPEPSPEIDPDPSPNEDSVEIISDDDTNNIISDNDSDSDSDENSDNEDLTNTPDSNPPRKKQKSINLLGRALGPMDPMETDASHASVSKKKKKITSRSKTNCMWTKPSSRKGKKRNKVAVNNNKVAVNNANNYNNKDYDDTDKNDTDKNDDGSNINNYNASGSGSGSASMLAMQNSSDEDKVLLTPIPRFPDRIDDSPDAKIVLSKVYKSEKIELSEDRLSAGSSKGYRMVRATRGVVEGSWYFEIKIEKLGDTGHCRLGWATEKGDLQAPVGYDGNSFGYRDVDGSIVHKGAREKYGDEGYVEGDVIGFYVNLPDGEMYLPKPPKHVWFRGQEYLCAAQAVDGKEEAPKAVPGSEMSFFKNGVCQGVAFRDLCGGRYFPAASMYTLPNQPNCVVTFNFGPDFDFFPQNLDGRPAPKPMVDTVYHGFDGRTEDDQSNGKEH